MNIRNHCKERYAERLLNIDKNDVKQYIVQHDKEISQQLHELFDKSTCVWTGKVNDNPVSSFFICDDIILVADQQKSTLVTIYKCDFGFPTNANKMVIKELVKEITKLQGKKNKQEVKKEPELHKKQFEVERIDNEIETLKEKIGILEKMKNAANEQIRALNNGTELIDKDIKMYALRLVDSLSFKIDMQNMRK